MAKGSIVGNLKGKLGNMVAYSIKNSKNRETQGFRVYQPSVRNPKSYKQCVQRMRMKPINNFYRALKNVIDRGWQGEYYGDKSRRKFVSLAMRDFSGPYVIKDTETIVPGPFYISQGGLVTVETTMFYDSRALGYQAITDIFSKFTDSTYPNTWGELWAGIIANNTDIQDGDQLTFVSCFQYKDSFVYRVEAYLVDSTDTTKYAGTENIRFYTEAPYTGRLMFAGSVYGEDEQLVAGGVIHSREGEGMGHLRSTCRLAIADSLLPLYFSDGAYNVAVSSYADVATMADWPETPDDQIGFDIVKQITITPLTAAMLQTADGVGASALTFYSVNGLLGYFVTDAETRQLIDPSGMPLTVKSGSEVKKVLLKTGLENFVVYRPEYGSL